MTWAQLVILCMVELGCPVTANMVRNWIGKNCPSRYEKSITVSAVFHSPTHNNRTWALADRGTYKLLEPPRDIKALYGALKAYNAYHKAQPDGTVQPRLPRRSPASLSVATRSKSLAQSPESDASLHSGLQPPRFAPPPNSPLSFSLSSLPSVSSPAPDDAVAEPGSGSNRGAAGASAVKPLVLTKEALAESCAAWLMEEKCQKRVVTSPEDYRQPIDKTLAFIVSLGA
jgi:hypothetical protein